MAVYKGTVETHFEDPNSATGQFLFGSSNLVGQTFVMTFVYDTSLGTRTLTPTIDPTTDSVAFQGGDPKPSVTPIISATLTINNHTEEVVAKYVGSAGIENYAPDSYSSIGHSAVDTPEYIGRNDSNHDYQRELGAEIVRSSSDIPFGLELPFKLNGFSYPDEAGGVFLFRDYTDYDTVKNDSNFLLNYYSSGTLRVTSITVTRLDPAPHQSDARSAHRSGEERGKHSIRSFDFYDKWYYTGEALFAPSISPAHNGPFCAAQYCADGDGSLSTDYSWTYRGGFVLGQFDGFGRFEGDDFRYVGAFKGGKFHGHGKLECLGGPSYEGQFVQSRMVGDFAVGPDHQDHRTFHGLEVRIGWPEPCED